MAAFAVYLFVPLYHAPAVAQVVPDGSLTLPCPLNGPHFVVPAGCGRTVGSNLFQSFSHFNINAGESVTFTGDASVVNLLTRVTGNEASNINGPLKTDGIPGVNFFLINRNGV
ncbi:MAG: filamentous hemagglutinin N-terminal domain-containing protein, partial [Phycisphaerae bacterium]|nr:filamentous hemagglutinin N-terminal domain-containing protein [Phycisphaerae bacterium]